MDLDKNYPALIDLKARARRRIPHFAWEYLDSGTGDELAMQRSRAALDAVLLTPAVLAGEVVPDLSVEFLGQRFALPFGMAPVGMSGLFWPGAEVTLAQLAARAGLPYALSTVAAQTPETVGPHTGGNGWFQLYPPPETEIFDHLLGRAWDAGFRTLIVTLDVPGPSRRERQRRGGVSTPPKIGPRILGHVALCPVWALAVLRHGKPRVRTLEAYPPPPPKPGEEASVGLGKYLSLGWDELRRIREVWKGAIIAKGVLLVDDALRLRDEGIDAIWVSTHGGRQFDAAPAGLTALPALRAALGPEYPIAYDGAVASGLDGLRAISMGADLVMIGRAWHWGLGAFGAKGADHVVHVLREDMTSCMVQMGISRPVEARGRIWREPEV